jgi:ketosteroid isomerase-like protein
MDDFEKAVNAGDAGAVAALMTDRTVWADPNVPVEVGSDAIRSLWRTVFGQFKLEFSGPVEDVRVTGDVAVARGTWTMKSAPRAQGVEGFSDSGSWIVVFARQNDGSWKWDWLVANSDQPLPGSTASGKDEQALYRLQQDWASAVRAKDTGVVEQFLADEFSSNFDGRTQSKRQFLAEMQADPARISSAATRDVKAMVLGDTAFVHGLFIEKSTTGGRDTSQQVRYSEVYVKRDGRWQCVTQYLTKIQ